MPYRTPLRNRRPETHTHTHINTAIIEWHDV
jgi:hypothetical protein